MHEREKNTFRLIVDSIPGLVCTNTPAGELEIVNQPLLDYTGTTLGGTQNHLADVAPS